MLFKKLVSVLVLFCLATVLFAQSQPPLSETDLQNELEHRAFNFFWNEENSSTGLVKDRANNFTIDSYNVSSIASVGYALAALPIGVTHGWITQAQATQRATLQLNFFLNNAASQHGFYYHFLYMSNGQRAWTSEVSTIDTSILAMGALIAGQYLGGNVQLLANTLYQRMDFRWFTNQGGATPNNLLTHMGWTPESGFISSTWNSYCELMFLYILAMGAPTYSLDTPTWNAWVRPMISYAGYQTIAGGPLFFHQMAQTFINFQGLRDNLGYNYYLSSVYGTLVNRQFCINSAAQYGTFTSNIWGITACDYPSGYTAFQAPGYTDGTVSPMAATTSLIFTPTQSNAAMEAAYNQYGNRIWGRYGFSDAFNVNHNWYDSDVIGIDLGMMMLAIENYQTHLIWNLTSAIPGIQTGMRKAGLRSSTTPGVYNAWFPGDANGNGCVDDTDILQVLNNFLTTNSAGDVNSDGIVDDTDLLLVINHFLSGCN